jgi:hypothetical protein
MTVATGFWAIDVRNEELVNYGREALEELSTGYGEIRARDKDRTELTGALGPGGRFVERKLGRNRSGRNRSEVVFRHRFWLRTIIALVGMTSIAGGVWSGFGFPTLP